MKDNDKTKPANPFWTLSIGEALVAQGSQLTGLTTSEAEEKLAVHGPNTLKQGRKKSAIGLFFGQFKSSITLILIGAAILSYFLGDPLMPLLSWLLYSSVAYWDFGRRKPPVMPYRNC